MMVSVPTAYRQLYPRLLDFSPVLRLSFFAVDKGKENGAILIAASIVAAIRLRGEPIKPSLRLNAICYDSILLAKTILAQIEKG